MTFTQRLVTGPLDPSDVNIFFHGQLFLRSEDGETCEVGVNPLAINHILSIEVRTKQLGRPDLINMRHFGPLHLRSPEGMSIEVLPAVASPRAFKCETTYPIDFRNGTGAPDNDFRWILNFEGRNFHHPKELLPTVFGTKNVIRLKGGEYFFETAFRANPLMLFNRTGGGLADETFRGIGAIAGARVFLADNQSVVVKWNDDTAERVLTLTRTPNVTYEIYIENTPLFVQVDPMKLGDHEELVHYYNLIPESQVPAAARFKLTPALTRTGRDLGSPTIPCQPLKLDGSND